MAPKKHGFGKRKRKSKQSGSNGVKKGKFANNTNQLPTGKPEQSIIEKKDYPSQSEDSSSEEEVNPYQELVSSIKQQSDSDKSEVESDSDDLEDSNDDVDNDSEDEDSVDGSDDNLDEKENIETSNKLDDAKHAVSENESDNSETSDKSEVEDSEEEIDESETEQDDEDLDAQNLDPFLEHFEKEISEEDVTKLSQSQWTKSEMKIPHLGKCTVRTIKGHPQKPDNSTDLKKMHVKQSLCNEVKTTNIKHGSEKGDLSPLQLMVFKILNQYQDLYYPCRTQETGEHLRLVYCLHALNHVLKNRKRVISHNTKMKLPGNEDKDYRDQGLARPKVLIVIPFREAALRIVDIMISLLKSDEKSMVSNKKRFYSEYKLDNTDQRRGAKPEDYESTFTGNTDDHFRIGLGVAKKTLKLYTNFYASDIILASPLGLRTIIGSEGDKERDYDFLSSIEMLIFDQADILMMQNWDHIIHLMKHFHLQPKESHGTDFSRVRMWTLNGWSKYYRQNIILSSVSDPQILSLFNKHCCNYNGKITLHRPETKGSISQVVVQLPQVYHKLSCSSYSQLADDRFNFFLQKILPTHKDPVLAQTLIYVPSYFDFVRLRNYFVREDLSFVYISEYTKDKTLSRSRNQFFHGNAHFMLYTERVHFYRRFKVRGIKHIIFYELPLFPHFYSELCNMLIENRQENSSCTVMYSQYDVQKLTEIVGSDRASHMISSSKHIHMFVTGE
ncbi:U3 small nucleolar RNA-associated protein 25 homolog [Mytilus edulis]|uniref:U3 small nucleolar RNA-associated protein 25 homolog n=1 Tax=Mytilus edulis TaxID=6550 RepID=UPI0039EEF1C5